MKTTVRKIQGLALSLLAVGAITSCSDYDDYNTAPSDPLASGNLTLWENIQQNPQLSDFASLVKRTGFDAQLASTRAYTVWAPLNGTFNVADYQSLNDSTLLQQFVKGHVAQYGHVASGQLDERVHMLNGKSFAFTGQGAYTFGSIPVNTANLPGNNGVMHLINGATRFYPNIYEYIMANEQDTLMQRFFKQYELTELDTRNSVKGPVVGGIQTYIDSVLITSNSLLNTLNASLTNEDSTYTFLLPNDHAYQAMYDKVKPYYNFINTTKVYDVDKFTDAKGTVTKQLTVNAEYLSDSLTRRAIVRNLAFSNNDEYNKWITERGEFTDTMRSTVRYKFSNPREILSHATKTEPMSNGTAHIVDSLAFYPWETYLPELEINPLYWAYTENSRTRFNFATRTVNFLDPTGSYFGPDVTEFRYLWIYPTGEYALPQVFIELPGVMAATYKFYCVFMPTSAKPNLLNFKLNYCNANGNVTAYNFSSKFLESGKASDENPKNVNKTTAFTNNPEVADTVYLGQFTFPVAYNGLNEMSPCLHITNPISVFNKADMANYTRDVSIAAIIMKPVELAEFEENNKNEE